MHFGIDAAHRAIAVRETLLAALNDEKAVSKLAHPTFENGQADDCEGFVVLCVGQITCAGLHQGSSEVEVSFEQAECDRLKA